MLRRRVIFGGIGVLAVMASAVSLAWACVPNASITLSKSTAAPGETLTATFRDVPPDAPLDIRLNGEAGPLLARSAPRPAEGPFTLSLPIPADTPAGCHVLAAFVTSGQHQGHSSPPTSLKVVTQAVPNPDCGSPPPANPPPANPPAANPPLTNAPVSGGGAITAPVNPIVPLASGGKRITGTSRSETLTGTRFADVINCGAGSDRVSGGGGNDVINCGAGRDSVNGGGGDDRIGGGSGNDKLSGGAGADRLAGGSGKDKLAGGAGADRLLGGAGNDRLRGGAGKDRLFGNGGADLLFRGGSDRLFGGSGRNRIIG